LARLDHAANKVGLARRRLGVITPTTLLIRHSVPLARLIILYFDAFIRADHVGSGTGMASMAFNCR
jgi:hypothetical protein